MSDASGRKEMQKWAVEKKKQNSIMPEDCVALTSLILMMRRKSGETLKKIPAWQLTKVRNKNEIIPQAKNEGRTVHLASLMDLCHPQEYGVGIKISKIQRSSRTPR